MEIQALQEVSVQHQLHSAWIWGTGVWLRVEKIPHISCSQATYLEILLWDEQDFLWEITPPDPLEISLLTCWKLRKCFSLRVPNLLLCDSYKAWGNSPEVRHGWTAQAFYSVQGIAKHSGALWTQSHAWYLPTIIPRVYQCCSSRSTDTSAQLIRGTHLSLRASLRSHSPQHRQGISAWLLLLLLPSRVRCGREAVPVVSAVRGSPAAWHHAESSLGSWTAPISSGRVTLAAKWRQNCWSFCTAPSAPAPSHRLDPSQSRFNANLTNRLLRCYRWLRHHWLSLLEGAEAFLPFLTPL